MIYDESTYGWRAHIEHGFAYDGIGVSIARREPDRLDVMLPIEPILMKLDDAGALPAEMTGPTLRLPGDLGRVLLDALAAYYGGATDLRTTRADLLAERARVDRLIGMLERPRLLDLRDT